MNCPFCIVEKSLIIAEDAIGIAFLDAFPIAEGHTLVIPRLHVASLFDLPDPDLAQIWVLVAHVRSALADQLSPDAFSIGINDGEAAGQTVAHAHVHVIPRFHGDVSDPRGGVRWVIPEKAAYWENPS